MKQIRQMVESGSTVLIALVAVTVAFTYFQDRRVSRAPEGAQVVPEWERENARGIRQGPVNASVVITEFMDFECPFCARLAPRLDSIMDRYPQQVALVFQHFPLPSHQHAVPAAIAAECADRQGRSWPMYSALLAGQQTFGSVPWETFAQEAGVPDGEAFAACLLLPADSFPRIGEGIALGERTGVVGTPTTWINGRIMRPTEEVVKNLLQ